MTSQNLPPFAMEVQRNEESEKCKRFISFCSWKASLVIGTFLFILTVVLRTLPDRDVCDHCTEDDELIRRMLQPHILSRSERSMKGASIDLSLYKDMGWELSPQDALQVFDAYYECLMKKAATADKINVIAMLALEGQNMEMKCPICLRPDQDTGRLHIQWQHMGARDSAMRYIEKTAKFKVTDDMSLIISGVDITDAGQFFCVRTRDREYEQIYQLDVLFRERRKVLKGSERKNVLPVFNMTENNLKTFTLWSDWSDCNICGKVGHRRKVGLCMVKKISDTKIVEPVDLPIMELYPRGIPCRSTVLPPSIAKLKRIKYRRSETILENCYMTCPTVAPPVMVTDKTGKVIEVLQPGYYSIKDKPPLPPMVKRSLVYEVTGKNLVLKCPTKPESAALVRWQNKTIAINPLTIKRQTRGRVRLDSVNRLHIRSLRLYDSAPYNCWIKRRHVATIKVVVTKGMNKNLTEYITYAGLGLTIISVTLVCCCVFCGRRRKTMK